MTLREKQSTFARMLAYLIIWADDHGYQLTLGDAYRDKRVPYGHPRSFHRKRLAIDFNLFKGGKYMRTTEAHKPLGEYWESIGGSWGGRWGDGNHYSLGE
ncbi:MAG: M15 family metallopeptidase [Candidatus Binatia bacterium]